MSSAIIEFKQGVQLTDLNPELWTAILLFARVRSAKTQLPLVVTALRNGVHGGTSGYDPTKTPPSNSLHYRGLAVDLRSHDLDSADKLWLLDEARTLLGSAVYLILESPDTANEHYHLSV